MGAAHSAVLAEREGTTPSDTKSFSCKAGFKGVGPKGSKDQEEGDQSSRTALHTDAPRKGSCAGSPGPPSSTAHTSKASSFLAWAKRQSKQCNKTLQQFIVESAQLQGPAAAPSSAHGPQAATADGKQLSAPAVPPGLQDMLTALTSAQSPHLQDGPKQQQQQQQQGETSADGVSVPVLPPFQPYDGYVHGPPKPHCHEARVAAADGIQALRRTRDGELESMLRLVCSVFDVETATVALLTGEAIYITAACGALQACVCPDRWGFCGWSFLNSHHELLVVEDMDADARFSANFFVTDPAFCLKFYVAAPLISSNGHRLGTLCVMGQEARVFDAVKAQVLSNLAEMLVRQLEAKWVNALQSSGQVQGLLRATSCYSSAYLVLDLSSRPWRVLHMNEPAVTATGAAWDASYAELACFAAGRRERAAFDGLPLDTLFDVSNARLTWTGHGTWEFTLSGLTLPNSSSSSYSLCCKPAGCDGLDEDQPFYVGVPSWLALSDSNTWGRNYFFARLLPEQQQQQVPFVGDSVEQLMQLPQQRGSISSCGVSPGSSTELPSFPASAATTPTAACDGSSSSSSGQMVIGGDHTATDYTWLPRGLAPVGVTPPPPGSSGSNASGLAAGSNASPLSSSRSLGSWAMSGAESARCQPVTPGGSSSRRSSSRRSSTDIGSSSDCGSSAARLVGVPPSVASVGSNGGGGSSRRSGGSSTCVGSLLRGLPVPGLVLGPLLGRGSYGRVYRGLLKGRPVAVKVVDDVASLRLGPSGEPLEVTLTQGLRQTGVMATLGYAYADAAATPISSSSSSSSGKVSGRGSRLMGGTRSCWMLFEYCNKGVLADAVVRGWFRTSRNPLTGAPDLRAIGLTALEVAAAMDHLHDKGVLHGDLCGGNVMLTSSSSAAHGFTTKVGDFGLVRTAAAAAGGKEQEQVHPVEQRLANNAYGTITHQPPEVLLEGSDAFTGAADVYAWGVLLWEMLTGSRAWAGLSAPSVVVQVAVLKRTLAIPQALPPVLKTLLTAALNPDPAQRPSFRVIVDQLTAFVQSSRAVDWEGWQAAVDAAHAAQVAAITAAEAAATAAAAADAAAGADAAPAAAAVSTGTACASCPLVSGSAAAGVPA